MRSKKGREAGEKPMRNRKREERMSKDKSKEVSLSCLKAKEAAEFAGVSPALLWMLKDAHAIPFYQLRPRSEIMYPLDGLRLWVKNNRPRSVGKGGGFHE